MATHSSILAWRIPWTEEPGGLHPIGSQRVRQDCATKHSTVIRRSYYLVAQLGKNLPVMQETTCNTGDMGSIPGLGRCPGEGNGNTLQNSYLRNPMDRGAWRATLLGVVQS